MTASSKAREHELSDVKPSPFKSHFPGKLSSKSFTTEHGLIDVKPTLPKFRDEITDDHQEWRIPFFKSGSRRRGDTWIISVFVILHTGVFIATMLVNDCWTNSHGDCILKDLGRLSFQPLSENPLLGPSESKLDEMGALRRIFLTEYRQTWRLFTFPVLHAGAIHLVINICSMIFVGIHLEQEFGPLRIGIIYILSSFVGSLVASLFIQNIPAVGASGALYGLLGSMLSTLIWNWKYSTNKIAVSALLVSVFVFNFALGLLPYVDNFSSIGGFISGFLLGSALLVSPQLAPDKAGLIDYGLKSCVKLKLKKNLDRPIMRILSLVLLSLIVAGCAVAIHFGINISDYCAWLQYVDCVPSRRWHCQNIETSCETMVNDAQLTLTCMRNGNFRIFPYTNISTARKNDLCTMICL
ncbi:RHOMBOID-like protein 8 [Neltuma alba]|uniref:RHOMBOID-like protein 8 n=1 Tax=Neltuma alba TaxID=207710 RepID=UPI0010A50F53|nr:RHOMBOID-like protein 8 [Prosopis alba]